MALLETKLSTLSAGAESVACVLANWENVLGVIGMASCKFIFDLARSMIPVVLFFSFGQRKGCSAGTAVFGQGGARECASDVSSCEYEIHVPSNAVCIAHLTNPPPPGVDSANDQQPQHSSQPELPITLVRIPVRSQDSDFGQVHESQQNGD